MSRTMAGEHMIEALDARLSKVRSTATELERVGVSYNRIIELCISNPPKDTRHLRALEEQVCRQMHVATSTGLFFSPALREVGGQMMAWAALGIQMAGRVTEARGQGRKKADAPMGIRVEDWRYWASS